MLSPVPRPALPPRGPSHPERGFALLLVLLLIAIALTIVSDLAYQSGLEWLAAENVSDLTKIEYSIDGQLELALAHLTYDKKQGEGDSESDDWNRKELKQRTDGEVALKQWITDECGKFNLSRLTQGTEAQQTRAKDILVRILDRFRDETDEDLSLGTAQDLAERIVAYLKRDSGVSGTVPRPKTSTPGVPMLLDELVFVDPKRMPDLLRDMETKENGKIAPGLWRYLTVFGPGKVNLNTAPLTVLQAFFSDNRDRDLAQAIIDRRNKAPTETSGTAPGMSSSSSSSSSSGSTDEATGNPFTAAFANELTDGSVENLKNETLVKNGIDPGVDFDFKSDFFSIRLHGDTKRTTRMELFIVERVATDGFRFLLHQERTDARLEIASDTSSTSR